MISLVDLMDVVGEAMREVAASIIEPRFRSLCEDDIRAKSGNELVTIADTEAELALTTRLESLLPGVPVVGEEACAADPNRLGALRGDRA
jgi:fructose-1,6-bisphosphatase/inositol monophosphatase family enzyme